MDPIEQAFLSSVPPAAKSAVPMISARDGTTVDCITPRRLWQAVRQPVHFQNTIRDLERTGPHTYIDLGPSGTLANFVKYNLDRTSQSTFQSTVTPFGYRVP
jgi:acyl transferase domain-containing protein